MLSLIHILEAPGETRLFFRRPRREPGAVHARAGSATRPRSGGPPLNYFVYPYVEIGGKEYPNVAIAFSFEDADSTPTKVSALR